MNKEARTSVPINDFARIRWSPRAFYDAPVEKEKLFALFEAARWSASGGNEQPWRFMLGIRPDETWQKIFSVMDKGNQVWNAIVPVLVLTIGKNIYSSDGSPSSYFQYDVGQSAAHLSLEAMCQGLHVHQMAGFSKEKAIELFKIPLDFIPLTVIAIGYLGSPEILDPKLKAREEQERTRKELTDLIFTDVFGKPSDLLNP